MSISIHLCKLILVSEQYYEMLGFSTLPKREQSSFTQKAGLWKS